MIELKKQKPPTRRDVYYYTRFYSSVTGGACSHNTVNSFFAKAIVDRENFAAFKCNGWDEYEFDECIESIENTYMGEYVDKKYVLFS